MSSALLQMSHWRDRDQDTEWMLQGVCRHLDPDLFFPPRGGDVYTPKLVCATCPVQDRCLDYALEGMEKFGIWGGKTERERRKIRRGRRLGVAS